MTQIIYDLLALAYSNSLVIKSIFKIKIFIKVFNRKCSFTRPKSTDWATGGCIMLIVLEWEINGYGWTWIHPFSNAMGSIPCNNLEKGCTMIHGHPITFFISHFNKVRDMSWVWRVHWSFLKRYNTWECCLIVYFTILKRKGRAIFDFRLHFLFFIEYVI